MDIDIERLNVDESLWPDGAEWLIDHNRFVKWVGSQEYCMNINSTEWRVSPNSWPRSAYITADKFFHIIPRPKPADEWVNGLPPEGVECEYELHGGRYEWCQIKAHRGSGTWITTEVDDRVVRNDLTKFRPLRTQAEREREKVINEAWYIMDECNNGLSGMAAALYDAGMLRKPAEEVGRDELMEMIGESYSYALSDDIADAILSTYNVTKRGG